MKKKRYRLKKKRIFLVLVVLIIIPLFIFNFNDITNYIKYKSLSYSNNSISLFNDKNIKIDKYSKTLDEIINTDFFIEENVDNYLDIVYLDRNDFYENINKLISLGYDSNEINKIYDKVGDIDIVLNNDYNENMLTILESEYYKEENLARYLSYDDSSNSIVLNVNMNLDYEFYTYDIEVENVDNEVIINKYYKLDKGYVPELVKLDRKFAINDNQQVTNDTKIAFEKMCTDALNDNIYIYSASAYRSYSYQNTLYNNRVKNEGLEYANKTAAKAGYSEHQTGLAMDLMGKDKTYLSSDDKEYKWLVDNSYKYGFILRYPEGKESITGYGYEPWHFRYISVEIATYLKEKNLTYDEYIGMKN